MMTASYREELIISHMPQAVKKGTKMAGATQ